MIGRVIHVTHDVSGLAFNNRPDLPCRAAIVTGDPSSVTGLTPVHIMPPYTSAYNAVLNMDNPNAWHDVGAHGVEVTPNIVSDSLPDHPLVSDEMLHEAGLRREVSDDGTVRLIALQSPDWQGEPIHGG